MVRAVERWTVALHAAAMMERRGISEAVVADVLLAPEQRNPARPGRDVLQRRISFDGKMYIVRVFVDVDRDPVEVVTVYRTSKIEKYWSSPS